MGNGLKLTVDDKMMRKIVNQFPNQVRRAGEISLDRTAFEVRDAIKKLMGQVFDNPTRYTLNSLRVQRTKSHNMMAAVFFKEPDRMGKHYLVPQVDGGARRLKGFERALGDMPFMPSKHHPRLNRHGNLPYGWIVNVLSVLGRAEHVAGFSSNITAGSKKRNRKPRDYVHILEGRGQGVGRSRGGGSSGRALPPGVYKRTQTGVGFGHKTKKTLPFGEYQKGRRRGRFASVIKARGLRPVLIRGKSRTVNYHPRLPFYSASREVIRHALPRHFLRELVRQTARRRR